MSNIVIVGAGTVGFATGASLAAHGYPILFVDSSSARRAELSAGGWDAAPAPRFGFSQTTAFVCVPTPAGDSGYDLSGLEQAVRSLVRAANNTPVPVDVVIRSTVAPGTCEGPVTAWIRDEAPSRSATHFPVVHCPEFLREARAFDDARSPRSVVIGATDPSARKRLERLMSGSGAPVETFDTATAAELVKCAHNAYNATKISFWNEIETIARHLGVDGHAVAKVVSVTAEASWNPDYGIRGGAPFAGKCLPKDILGLISRFRDLGLEPSLLTAVHERNQRTDPL